MGSAEIVLPCQFLDGWRFAKVLLNTGAHAGQPDVFFPLRPFLLFKGPFGNVGVLEGEKEKTPSQ